MKPLEHFLIAGTAGIVPDIALAFFVGRKTWIPESNKLVKVHRFIHSPSGLIFFILLGISTHIVLDWFSPHRINFNERVSSPPIFGWSR